MIKLFITLLVVLGMIQNANGQELASKMQFLKENLVSVNAKKTTYDQAFSQSTEHPFVVSVKITDTKSGDETIKTINAEDLNASRIIFEPKKDLVHIVAQVKGDKRLVKVVENGEIKNYDSKLLFYAAGIEEARGLTDAFESIVELADKKVEESSSGLGKQDLLARLTEATGNVVINDETYQQQFTHQEENPSIITIEIENVSKKLVEEYTVNAADLYLTKIEFDTKRNQVLVLLKTKADSKLVSYVKNGETGNFTNEFEIMLPSIEDARTYTSYLKEFVQISESEERTDFTGYSYDQCLDYLVGHIGKVVINQDTYEQSFAANQDNHLILEITSRDISKGEQLTYAVNAAYLQKGRTQFDTKGNTVLIELTTDGNRKLISTKKGEEAANYTNGFTFRGQHIEEARDISEVFTRMKELARNELEEQTAFTGAMEAEEFIMKSAGKLVINTDTYLQSYKVDDENACLYTYEFTDVSKDTQYGYEFNLQDVDVPKIQFDTRGTQAIVNVEIQGKRKLIQTYKDGELDKYVYEFQILAKDIEQARLLVSALKVKTESCKKE